MNGTWVWPINVLEACRVGMADVRRLRLEYYFFFFVFMWLCSYATVAESLLIVCDDNIMRTWFSVPFIIQV